MGKQLNAESVSFIDENINDRFENIVSLNDDSPRILSPFQSQQKVEFYQKQASETRNALNSLRIAFESQKRLLTKQDERIKTFMISRSNSLSNTKPIRSLSARTSMTSRSQNRSRPNSAISRTSRRSRPNSAISAISRNSRRSRPSSAKLLTQTNCDKVRNPLNKLSTNRMARYYVTRFSNKQ